MCGIGGIIGKKGPSYTKAAQCVLARIGHRGPDGNGHKSYSNDRSTIEFLHARLAILDPANGSQPMTDNGYGIVFNGLIYNFRELRTELEALDYTFTSRTDTEVLLKSYQAWGKDCLSKLTGMFAFAIYDPKAKMVFIARDRMGQKPVYYAKTDTGAFIFASEVRAIAHSGLVKKEINSTAVDSFLSFGAIYSEETIFSGIKLMRPGHYFIVSEEGEIKEEQSYWDLKSQFEIQSTSTPSLKQLVENAISSRLVTDVPLGVFLSGGIDSNIIATVARGHLNELTTINIGFDVPEHDESAAAQRMAKHLGTNHCQISLSSNEIIASLSDVFAATDQPSVDVFNTYFVTHATKEAGITTALSGVGGDELFAGYASFKDIPLAMKVRKLLQLSGPMITALSKHSKSRAVIKFGKTFEAQGGVEQLYNLRRQLFLDAQSNQAPNLELPQTDIINQLSFLEMSKFMRHMLLRDVDVMSLVNGVEVRTPFLDHKLIEAVVKIPGKNKLRRQRLKPLLVDQFPDALPGWLTDLPKKGFTFPWNQWFRGPLKNLAKKCMENSRSLDAVGITNTQLQSYWRMFESNDARCGGLNLLALIVLDEYLQRNL